MRDPPRKPRFPVVTRSRRERQVPPGASGGSASEADSSFRAGVAAYIAAHILRGQAFANLELPRELAVPVSMVLEADAAVEDIVVASGAPSPLATSVWVAPEGERQRIVGPVNRRHEHRSIPCGPNRIGA
jgi:hypothetical protein